MSAYEYDTYVHEGHAGLESSNLLQYGEFSSVLELEQFNVEFRLLRTPGTNVPNQYLRTIQLDICACLKHVNRLCATYLASLASFLSAAASLAGAASA
jgi:hypothetical protein